MTIALVIPQAHYDRDDAFVHFHNSSMRVSHTIGHITHARSGGRGGRNTEFLLGFAIAAAGEPDVFAFAADSDGIDGTEDAAGAIVTPDTLARARAANLDVRQHLVAHDSYCIFAAIGDLIHTGPTGTNVNDIRAILISRGGRPTE